MVFFFAEIVQKVLFVKKSERKPTLLMIGGFAKLSLQFAIFTSIKQAHDSKRCLCSTIKKRVGKPPTGSERSERRGGGSEVGEGESPSQPKRGRGRGSRVDSA